MKNGGKNKSVAFIILVSVYIIIIYYIYIIKSFTMLHAMGLSFFPSLKRFDSNEFVMLCFTL